MRPRRVSEEHPESIFLLDSNALNAELSIGQKKTNISNVANFILFNFVVYKSLFTSCFKNWKKFYLIPISVS